MTNEFSPALSRVGAANDPQKNMVTAIRSTDGMPESVSALHNDALGSSDGRSVPSVRTGDRLLPIENTALLLARQRGFTPGYESEDWIKAKAEVLGQLYSLTGAGS
jgi:hypothetical protein